jgi:hypothetical protein
MENNPGYAAPNDEGLYKVRCGSCVFWCVGGVKKMLEFVKKVELDLVFIYPNYG